ncbi:MAG: restriction endonuclease subunit M [Prevotella sp.]|nr:restriction endonuclease subunit M [Prevotella sp.]
MPDNSEKFDNDILGDYGRDVLETLLVDHSVTTAKNDGRTHHIFWATDDYEVRGDGYRFFDEISIEAITGANSDVVIPRVLKRKELKKKRVKEKAEIFTPSWMCNFMVNNLDERFFGYREVFNKEINDRHNWVVNRSKIAMPEGKTWQEFVKIRWMEYCCGEAPFIVSRYDTTTGDVIPIERRIGFLDRKLRIVSENTKGEKEWLEGARMAYQNTLGNEWAGDSLLLARENLLYTFSEYFVDRFGHQPTTEWMKIIADIISWNIMQMDGLKLVVPCTCHDVVTTNLLGEKEVHPCPGCKAKDARKHNGIPVLVKSWSTGLAVPLRMCLKSNKR